MNTKVLYISFICAIFFGACSKDFTDLSPISDIATSNFYKTSSDFKNAVSGAYGALQFSGVFGNIYVFGDVASDDTYPAISGSVTDQDQFDKFYLITTNPFISGAWNDSYKGIARCNAILDRIDAADFNADLKKQYTNEAKFVRALIYFNLVRIYGNVPLVLKEITNPDQGYEYNRNPKAEVYAQIEKDLSEAIDGLKTKSEYAAIDMGRATKGAAQSLLGKVLLTEHKYTEAAVQLKKVIDSQIYDLLPLYADVFKVSNKNHKESVLDVQYKAGSLGEGNGLPNSFAPENSGNAVIQFGGGGNNRPSADLEQAFESGDARKDASMATFYINTSGKRVDYYYCKKYWDTPIVSGDNNNNFPIIRYSDVILMYAECLNEAGYVSDGDAFVYLNKVRKRALLNDKTSATVANQASFRLAIEQERRVEFAFEGQRWFDLVRTGRAIPVLNAKATQIGIKKTLTEDNMLFPVPQSQVDINKDKIKQNTGY